MTTLLSHTTVADGTPRDCSSNRCGSQADTAIIRDREIRSGDVGPLGRTQGNGPVSAETMINNFMGDATAPTNNGTGVGVEDNLSNTPVANRAGGSGNQGKRGISVARQFLSNLLGGLGGGGQGDKNDGPPETAVAATAGDGASRGLPTCADDGTITMTYRQVSTCPFGPFPLATSTISPN